MNDTFYFVIHPRGDKSKVKVVDLGYSVSYQKNEWDCINKETFTDCKEAISYARKIAHKYNLQYQFFESRYNSDLNEKTHYHLTLTEEEEREYD